MKRMILCALLAAAMMPAGFAQVDKKKLMGDNPASPATETTVTINGKQIWIVYHAPSVKGRKIFGGADALQPDDSVWRAGADYATVLHTDAALDINGLMVPAGEYSLYIALDKGKWQLLVSKQTGQWGINRDGSTTYDESKAVGKTAMQMSKPNAPVERLRIELSSAGGNKGKLAVAWENIAASVPFTVK
jgi:hypothetical protein